MSEPRATSPESDESVRGLVRDAYERVAQGQKRTCCGGASASSGCGSANPDAYAAKVGYSAEDQSLAPDGANLGLGCGNPTALAELSPGEVVLDLGAGAGFDAFIAAERVGPTGRVLGVDMTPGMLERARRLAVDHRVHGYVEFREGLVEELPVAGASVDVVISNCVINLVPDKGRAFREAFRVLKSGGRLAVSDILLEEPLDEELRALAELYVGCVAGAIEASAYLGAMEAAGFVDVTWTRAPAGFLAEAAGDRGVTEAVAKFGAERLERELKKVWSYQIRARKP